MLIVIPDLNSTVKWWYCQDLCAKMFAELG